MQDREQNHLCQAIHTCKARLSSAGPATINRVDVKSPLPHAGARPACRSVTAGSPLERLAMLGKTPSGPNPFQGVSSKPRNLVQVLAPCGAPQSPYTFGPRPVPRAPFFSTRRRATRCHFHTYRPFNKHCWIARL